MTHPSRFYLSLLLTCLVCTAQSQETNSSEPVIAAKDHLLLETTQGNIVILLFADKARFYDGTIFHRVIDNFMIQGGGFTEGFTEKPTRDPIINESTNRLLNKRGTVAMARTSIRNSATSQFYINVGDNAALDYMGEMNSRTWGYAVFGEVVQGMEVVDKIRSVPTGPAGPMHPAAPLDPIIITSASMVSGPLTPAEVSPEESPEAVSADTDG